MSPGFAGYSATSSPAKGAAALKALGVRAYLAKPFDVEVLLALVTELA